MVDIAAFDWLAAIETNDRHFSAELQAVVSAIVRKWNWGNSEGIDDIVQDCLLRLLQNIRGGKFRGESSLKTYIYAIARNTCIDYYREWKTLESIDIDLIEPADESLSAEDRLIYIDQRRIACQVLLSLPVDCRRLWRAIFFGRRNYEQAGELLKLSEGTVKRRMWECRKLARERLKTFD